jgi:hypothetical protein
MGEVVEHGRKLGLWAKFSGAGDSKCKSQNEESCRGPGVCQSSDEERRDKSSDGVEGEGERCLSGDQTEYQTELKARVRHQSGCML